MMTAGWTIGLASFTQQRKKDIEFVVTFNVNIQVTDTPI
jgi:hypothetical protein